MSDTSHSSDSQPARRFQRAGRGFNVALQIILFVIVIIAANYLSCARHERIDLTENRDFTLADTTTQYLQSDAVQSRDAAIEVTAIIRRTSPHYTRIYNLLDEYRRVSKGKLNLQLVDPLKQTDRALEIEKTYGIEFTDDMIIVDGRTTEQKKPSPNAADPAASEELEKAAQAHIKVALIKDLPITDDKLNIVGWQDEDVITSRIIGAIEGFSRKVYIVMDKSDLIAKEGQATWETIGNMLIPQNISLVKISLAESTSIPEDAECLVLLAPQYDLTDSELAVVEEYWERNNSSIFITLDPDAKLDKLRIFLRGNGITPRSDRLTSIKDNQTRLSAETLFLPGSEINKSLGGKSTIFEGSSSSLEIREDDDTLVNRNIKPIALIRAAKGWWGETRYDQENPTYNMEEDTSAPLYLAAAVTYGDALSAETADLVSKMVIISNNHFLSSKKTRPEQADFVKSSVNWLVGREDLIGIGPKKLYLHKITIINAHSSFINRILLFFLPAIAILIALIVWNMRRA